MKYVEHCVLIAVNIDKHLQETFIQTEKDCL